MVAFITSLDDECADDGEVISHKSVWVSILFVHGKDHTVVHLNQSILQLLRVFTFCLYLRQFFNCSRTFITNLKDSLYKDLGVVLDPQGKISKATQDLSLEFTIDGAMHVIDEFLENSCKFS